MTYKPINCDFHSILESKATTKSEVTLSYSSEEILKEIKCVISNIYTVKGKEFLETNDGLIIRLDKIKSIDHINSPSFRN